MAETKDNEKETEKNSRKAQDWPLPYCTTAPAAEHYRAEDEDEPCDDSRGKVDEKNKGKASK